MDKKFFEININKYNADKNYILTRPSSLKHPHSNSVMFCTKENIDASSCLNTVKECLVFWPENISIPDLSRNQHVFIKAKDPRQAYAMFFSDNKIEYLPQPSVYEIVNGAYIAKGAKIGKNSVVFPGVYIDKNVVIGNNCYIATGAKLMGEVRIGNNVVLRENTVIGSDGLSTMRKADGTAATIPQFGGVILEDNVQIGANTVISRGAIDNTIIHKGCKVDNSCFISHNVEIGADSFIVGETIMFGSSSTGEQVYISGNSTILEGIHIGSNALIGMGAVVVKTVSENAIVKGNPAR